MLSRRVCGILKRNSRVAVGAGGAREARAHVSAASWNAHREKCSDRWDAHANKSDVHVSSLRMRGFLVGKGGGGVAVSRQ